MASLPLSRGCTYTSTDTDDSDTDIALSVASCNLQEIRQEDLAAILPDQQDCDAFGEFECRAEKNSTQTGDASGSDMELPQQAVNALIQRTTESSSESESHAPPNPSTLYANSLLQQFVAQTQLLNTPCAALPNGEVGVSSQNSENNASQKVMNGGISKDNAKRKRGRPKKNPLHGNNKKETGAIPKATTSGEYCANPNVSPDSGIQNSPDHVSSPESCPSPSSKSRQAEVKRSGNEKTSKTSREPQKHPFNNKPASNNLTNRLKEQNKLPVTSNRFDRLLYANADRVLYPPRRKVGRPPINRKGPGRPPKHKTPTEPSRSVKESDTEKAALASVSNGRIVAERNNGKLNKPKKYSSSRDKEMNQLASTTSSLSLDTKVNGVKDTTTRKTKSKLLYEICERVSRRLEINGKPVQQKVSDSNVKPDRNEGIKSAKTSARKNKSVVDNKLKLNNVKVQYTTLKNAKLMHSKHKHKKHKKCKFKILKPLSATVTDTKINIEIEKLIADFMKYCSISSSRPSKENIPEILRALKKASKKRKTSEYNERKKKKQTVSSALNKEANSNEQRLPLKKRHYHLSASSENKPESPELANSPADALNDAKSENKAKSVVNKTAPAANAKVPVKSLSPSPKTETVKASPTNATKYIPVIKTLNTTHPKMTSTNNNEYEAVNTKSESVDCHIDEAIEACITRFSGEQNKVAKTTELTTKDEKVNTSSTSMTTTTPKKRHRLEQCASNTENGIKQEVPSPIPATEREVEAQKNKTSLESVVHELKLKRNLTNKVLESSQKKAEKKQDAVAQIMTRKKNRLEDLTSSLVSKIASPIGDGTENQKRKKEEVNRDSVIKYPACKKVKPSEDKLDFIDAKPTGIFMPSTDLENLIPVNTIELKKETPEETKITRKFEDPLDMTERVIKPQMKIIKNPEALRKRIRKRRAINRTGFPTVKRKKKKSSLSEVYITESEDKASECDRVPKAGEEYSKFLQRTEKCYPTTDNIQKSHSEVSLPTNSDLENSKWEGLSECDSLPQEERIEIEQDDILRLDLKHAEKMCLRSRDLSPTTSVDTLSDRSRIKSQEDLDELPLEVRVQRIEMKVKNERARQKREMLLKKRKHREDVLLKKRKLRDVSPASSMEQFLEKRLKEERASPSSDEMKRFRKIPRWRKRYLVAGLFSDYYKEDE